MVSQYQGVTIPFTIHVADAMDIILCSAQDDLQLDKLIK